MENVHMSVWFKAVNPVSPQEGFYLPDHITGFDRVRCWKSTGDVQSVMGAVRLKTRLN